MRILVTGSHGQLGNELRRCFDTMQAEIGAIDKAYEGASVEYIDYDVLDISDAAAVSAWFADKGPYNLVINCAAVTNVDGCEKDEAIALNVNALGPRNLALEQAASQGEFLHVSTDYVFPGNEPTPRNEDDAVCPVSAYGRTKLAGELLAIDVCPSTYIVRTAWLYGYVGNNFVKTMLRLAKERGAISVVSDQFGNPTNANDLAYEILKIAQTGDYGVYHCTNEGTCSWFDFACAVVDASGVSCKKEPLSSAEYKRRFPASASRPAYSSLDNKRLRETVGNEMRPWRAALAMYMKNLAELGD